MADVTISSLGSIAVTSSLLLPAANNTTTGKVTIANINSQITSSNVTTALGYTPYNNTNPNGYITGITSGNVTTALGYTPVQQGGGTGQSTNKLYVGWSGSNLLLQVDNNNFGNTWPISVSGNAATASNGAKAWVNFDGRSTNGACALNKSYNISAVSRTGSGIYSITINNDVLSDANYLTIVTCRNNVDSAGIGCESNASKSATSVSVAFSRLDGAGQINPTKCFVVLFGT